MALESQPVAEQGKSPSHPVRVWLRSLGRRVSRPRFWIALVITCISVWFLEDWFERKVEEEEYPGVVQKVFGLTWLYQWTVTQQHFPYPRYTAVVVIDSKKQPNIPNYQKVCEQREVIAKLIRRVHTASPAVIAVDKYFAAECPQTDSLRKAIESVTGDTPVVVGKLVDQEHPVSTKTEQRYFFGPSVPFEIQSPNFHEAVVNIDPDTRKISFRWEVYESEKQAQKPTSTPEYRRTLPLQASWEHPGGLLQNNSRITSLIKDNLNPFTSFLKPDDFRPILAGDVLASSGPAESWRQQIAGRVVLIGEIEYDGLDSHFTVEGKMSGLLLQANYIEALLDDRVFRSNRCLDYVFGGTFLIGLEASFVFLRWYWRALAIAGLLVSLGVVLFLIVQLLGWYIDPAPLSVIPVATKILGILFGWAEEALLGKTSET